eukprot:5107950-Prymnesium_polylepis.1
MAGGYLTYGLARAVHAAPMRSPLMLRACFPHAGRWARTHLPMDDDSSSATSRAYAAFDARADSSTPGVIAGALRRREVSSREGEGAVAAGGWSATLISQGTGSG